jgi:Flp pilus assembly protein TadB
MKSWKESSIVQGIIEENQPPFIVFLGLGLLIASLMYFFIGLIVMLCAIVLLPVWVFMKGFYAPIKRLLQRLRLRQKIGSMSQN